MKSKTGVFFNLVLILTACLFCIETAFGQITTTAVPFLLISPSPEANGQGCTSVSRISDDPYAIYFNPAHLGISSIQNNVMFSFYPSKTMWLPGLGINDLTYNTLVLSGGANLEEYLSLPLSIGIGYSRVNLDLGKFVVTTAESSDGVGTSNSEEHSDAFSLGAGLDFGIKVALGITFRKTESNLVGLGASAWSRDYGLLIEVPVTELINKEFELMTGIAPICNLSFGSALTNIGDKIKYMDANQADPLPRNISIGASMEIGLNLIKTDNKIISFSWSRQADNLLVGRNQDGSSYYRNIFGDLSLGKHIIQGKLTDAVKISQGWQIGLGEILYIREGSFNGGGFDHISTDGWGISTSGLIKIIKLVAEDNSLITQLIEHFNIHYDESSYSTNDSYNPLNSTKFSSLSLFIKL
ncbi:MAG: hypothetical protein JXA06_03180 [Bacteroidetes bacterium]|nr:hypothetical protein [Bacteroidota bacterium]